MPSNGAKSNAKRGITKMNPISDDQTFQYTTTIEQPYSHAD
ncbi:hypothetical protein WA016_06042 [Myxococcus stipitatus]